MTAGNRKARQPRDQQTQASPAQERHGLHVRSSAALQQMARLCLRQRFGCSAAPLGRLHAVFGRRAMGLRRPMVQVIIEEAVACAQRVVVVEGESRDGTGSVGNQARTEQGALRGNNRLYL